MQCWQSRCYAASTSSCGTCQLVSGCNCKTLMSVLIILQVDIYQDEDSSRKDDIASLKSDQGDFKVFYDRVKDLKDFYRNKPIEVTEVSVTCRTWPHLQLLL